MTDFTSNFISPPLAQSLANLAALQEHPVSPDPAQNLHEWETEIRYFSQALIAENGNRSTPINLMAKNLREVLIDPDRQYQPVSTALASLFTILSKHGLVPQASEEAQAVTMRFAYTIAISHLRHLGQNKETSISAHQAAEIIQRVFTFFQVSPTLCTYVDQKIASWKDSPPSRNDVVQFLAELISSKMAPTDFWRSPENIIPFVAQNLHRIRIKVVCRLVKYYPPEVLREHQGNRYPHCERGRAPFPS